MVTEGFIRRIVHEKLASDVVYFAKGSWPLDFSLQIEAEALGIKDKEKVAEEARKIVDEAQVEAEKMVAKKV